MLSRLLLFLLLLSTATGHVARAQGVKDLLLVPIRDTPASDKIAIVIGVDDYFSVGKLSACGKDARAFAKFLSEKWNFPAQSIVLMTDTAESNRKPDRVNIRRVLRNALQTIDENSEVVIFFSGHGLRDRELDYLAPIDADSEDIAGTCIEYNDLRNKLEGKNPRRCLLVTDACRNLKGKAVGGESFGKSVFSSEPQFAELRSCRPGQKSQEMPDGSLGVFTNFLIKGLSGEAATLAPDKKTITFDALKRYVTGETRQYVLNELEAAQTPDGRASFGDMVLGETLAPKPPPVAPDSLEVEVEERNRQVKAVNRPSKVNAKDGAEMVWVPAGYFLSGIDSTNEAGLKAIDAEWGIDITQFDPQLVAISDEEKPKRISTLNGFYIYKTEVTVAQYQKFCLSTGRKMPDAPSWGWIGNHPIVNVTYDDAKAYCSWAGAKLPSALQWEKAARGTDGRLFPWGNKWSQGQALGNFAGDEFGATSKIPTYRDRFQYTAPVGSFPAGVSPYGAFDMAGNVSEYCEDTFDMVIPPFFGEMRSDWIGETYCKVRGGSWPFFLPTLLRSTRNQGSNVNNSSEHTGFRCVISGL